MKKKPANVDAMDDLRTRTEKFLAAKGADLGQVHRDKVRKLVQDLQAHQVGLERQNEALRRSREALAEAQARYVTLYDFAPMAYFTLDPHGLITEVNAAGVRLLGEPRDALLQTPFIRFVAPGNQADFQAHLQSEPAGGVSQSGDLLLRPHHGPPFSGSLESLAVFDAGGAVVRYHTVVRDITKLKQTEENLRKSEALYRLIVETANEGIWGVDADYQTTYVNPVMAEMLGYRVEEMLGRPISGFIFPEDLNDHQGNMTQCRLGLDETYERRFKRQDGSELWCIVSARSLMDDQGRFQGSFAMFTDITQRRQAEEALRLAAHQWQATFDAMGESICLMDLNCRILGCNQAMATLVGQPLDAILGCHCYEIVHGASQRIPECPMVTMCRSRQREEVVLPLKDRWVKVTLDPILDDAGAPLGAVHRMADITQLKKSEEALKESEAHFRKLFDSGADAIFLHDQGKIIEVNEQACRNLGYTREELQRLHITDLEVGIDRQSLLEIWKHEPPEDSLLGIHRRKDGSTFPVEIRTRKFPIHGRNLWLGIIRDITAQRQAEEAIRESEDRFRELFNHMKSGAVIYEVRPNGKEIIIKDFNRAAERIEGVKKKSVLGRDIREVFPGAEAMGMVDVLLRVWEGGRPEHMPKAFYRDARIEGWRDNFVYRLPSGEVVAVYEDITARVHDVQALHHSRETLRVLLDATPAAVMLLDPQGLVLAINRVGAKFLRKTIKDVVGTIIFEHVPEEVVQAGKDYLEEISRSRQPLSFEESCWGHDFVNYVHPILSTAGELTGFAVLSVDITERKQAEEALRRSRETLRALLDATPAAVILLNPRGIVLAANKILAERLGQPINKIVGTCIFDYFPADLALARQARMEEVRRTGRPVVFEDNRDGLIVDNYIHPIYSGLGNLVGFAVLSVDITARKQAEEALAQQAQFLQLLIDTIPTPIFYKNAEGRYLGCNQAFQDFYGLAKDQIVGNTVDCLGSHELVEKFRQMDLELFRTPGVQLYEYAAPRRDGRKREVVINKATFLKADGTVGGLIGVQTDVTEFKEAQEELRALAARLAEAEELDRQHLARELHDEVGQSLAALGLNLTLLKTQMPRETATSLLTRLADSVVLVERTGETIRNVMAELRPPVLDDYGLLSALRWYGAEFSQRTGIGVEVRGEEAAPRLARPVELALFRIAQEALTNVAKHAKASRVELTEEIQDGIVRLVIADNGVGFDQTLLGQPEGRYRWGLLNMSERAAAAGGSCRIESQPGLGTRVVVEVSR